MANNPTAALHKLARRHLASAQTRFPPHTSGKRAREALRQCAYGLHCMEGEHVVALLDHASGGQEFTGIVVTDRIFLARFGKELFHIPLQTMQGAELSEGFLQTSLRITAVDGSWDLPVLQGGRALQTFLRELVTLGYRPQGRKAPMANVSEDDPSGLKQMVTSLKSPDERVVSLLQLTFEELEAQRISTADALDMAVRLQCLHRTLNYGRCMIDGSWLSPLPKADALLLAQKAAASVWNQEIQSKNDGETTLLVLGSEEEKSSLLRDVSTLAKGSVSGSSAEETAATRASIQDKWAEKIEERIVERLEEKLVTSVLDRLSQKTLGVGVSELLGEDELEVSHVRLGNGPRTVELTDKSNETKRTAPVKEEGSYWDRLRRAAEAAKQLWQEDDPASSRALSLWQVEGKSGRDFVAMGRQEPDRIARFGQELCAGEIRMLALRILKGWEPDSASLERIAPEEAEALLTHRLPQPQARALFRPPHFAKAQSLYDLLHES